LIYAEYVAVNMSTDRKDSSDSCNTYKRSPIERYIGEGVLISEDGTKLPCKFEAGQLEDGFNFIVCDYSIFDLSRKEYFPNSNFENCSHHIVKNCMGWNLWATQGKIFRQFKSFDGVTSDGFAELKITGKIGGYFSIYFDTLRDDTSRIKVAYHLKEFSINANAVEDLQFMTFGVTNFEFDGNESQGNVLSLDIKGVKRLIIKKKGVFQDALHFWEKFKGIRVSCEVVVVIDKETQVEEVKNMVNDLCDLMSIACGTRVQWIYCYGYNTEGKLVSRNHRSSNTKPYQPMQLIREDHIWLKKFLEDSYEVFIEKQNLLKQNRYIIDKYLEAKAQNDLLEQRGIKLAGVIETLKGLSLKLDLPTEETIIREDCFEASKPAIKNALDEAIEKSVSKQYEEKSEESRRKIIQENKKEMFAKIHDLNRISFKQVLLAFCAYINLQVSENDLQAIVSSRNKLIHEGKFICQTYNDKNKLVQKYPNFKDPWSEYAYSLNFVDKCFLKMLRYKGYYINQFELEEEEL
jgi:hypothetical protein